MFDKGTNLGTALTEAKQERKNVGRAGNQELIKAARVMDLNGTKESWNRDLSRAAGKSSTVELGRPTNSDPSGT